MVEVINDVVIDKPLDVEDTEEIGVEETYYIQGDQRELRIFFLLKNKAKYKKIHTNYVHGHLLYWTFEKRYTLRHITKKALDSIWVFHANQKPQIALF